MNRIEELVELIDSEELYVKQRMHVGVFREFIRRFMDKDEKANAVKKWIEYAGTEVVDGKVQYVSGAFKEVELIDDDGNVLCVVPPIMNSKVRLDSTDGVDEILSISTKASDVYGEAGDSKLNFKMMEVANDIINNGGSTWDDIIKKYVVDYEHTDKQTIAETTETEDETEEFYD
jgi:hypothetical protein